MDELRHVVQSNFWLVIGLAALWACLHVSPYFPLNLMPAFVDSGLQSVVDYHLAYEASFVTGFAAMAAIALAAPQALESSRLWTVAAGALGAGGCGILALGAQGVGAVASLAAVGLSIAFFACALLSHAAGHEPAESTLVVAASYVLFSVTWVVLEALAHPIMAFLSATCPLVMAMCCFLLGENPAIARSCEKAAYKSLPWTVLGLSIAFVVFAVVSVRSFTAMDTGTASAGTLPAAPAVITAVLSLVIAIAMYALIAANGYGENTAIAMFSLLTLAFMAALLTVVVASGNTVAQIGRRGMVATEHLFELYVAIVLVSNVSRRKLSPTLTFAGYGIAVIALPQVASIDVLYRTGLLEHVSTTNHVAPIAAIAAFFVAASVVLLLVRSNAQAAQFAALSNDDWQRELCMRATAAYEVTPRELDVIVLTYRGLSAKRIAEELLVSESTVKAHLSHAYRKLDVHTKQDLIALVNSYRL